MKIAIDTEPLVSEHKTRGIGYYTRSLVEVLIKIAKNNKNLTIDAFNFRTKKDKLSSYNLIHYPYFDFFSLSLPFIKPTKIIVTVHDVIPLICPSHYPPGIRGNVKFLIQKCLLKKVDAVITDTEASKKGIAHLLGVSQNKIFPIHLAPAKHFKPIKKQQTLAIAKNKYKLPNRFVLYVGDVNYHKNLSNLAMACKVARVPLVMVGKKTVAKNFDKTHPEIRSWLKFLQQYSKDPNILRLGFVPDDDLVAIYNLATIYCQPSLHEGFGLPVLEAMACGCPVIASKTPALIEIAKRAAIFVDPRNAKTISRGLQKVLKSKRLRLDLTKKGFKHSQTFSWEKTARKTLEIFFYGASSCQVKEDFQSS